MPYRLARGADLAGDSCGARLLVSCALLAPLLLVASVPGVHSDRRF